jgi:DNA invertase Pin-like site-specific DNA recombinase
MIVGYARTSTAEQSAGLDAQTRDLNAAGAEELFSEQVSSVAERAALADALRFVRKGDVLVVTKPDRLARSTRNLLDIAEDLSKRGVVLRILSMGDLDASNPTGKLMLTMLGAVATFEREIMLERQREGIAAAKLAGKYKGRAPTAARRTADVLRLAATPGVTRAQIAKETKMSVPSVYRIIAAHRAANGVTATLNCSRMTSRD